MKAILINQSPNICDNMRNGTQQYIFNNSKFDSGMRGYVYEGLGEQKAKGYIIKHKEYNKFIVWVDDWNKKAYQSKGDNIPTTLFKTQKEANEFYDKYCSEDVNYEIVYINVYQGTGKVIGEFVIGNVYDEIRDVLYTNHISLDCVQKQGYTNQKYAYEITELIVYDYSTKNDFCYKECNGADCKYFEFTNEDEDRCNKPTKPLDISEFMSCKKIDNEWKGYYNAYKECLAFTPLSEEQYKQGIINGIAPSEIRNECKLTKPPTNYCLVVDKEI